MPIYSNKAERVQRPVSKGNHQKLLQLRIYRVHYFPPVHKSTNHHPQVDSIFLISVIAPTVRTVLENCEVLIVKNWELEYQKGHLSSSF